jgi:hypothetical protein
MKTSFVVFLPLFVLGSLSVCNCSPAGKKAGKHSRTSGEKKAGYSMTKDVFGFSDADYFQNPMMKIEEIRDSLEERRPNSILAGGPGFVQLDKVAKLPFAALRITESMDAYEHPFKQFALVVSMDVTSDMLYADMFVEQKFVKQKRDPTGTPPPAGTYSDGGAIDLFSRKIVPIVMGDFLNSVIILDKSSNRVRTIVGSSLWQNDPDKQHAAFEKRRQESKVVSQEPILKPWKTERDEKSPPIPEKPGIALVPDFSVQDSKVKPKWMIHVSYFLARRKSGNGISTFDDQASARIIPFSILATGNRIPNPIVWRMDVPVETPVATEAGFFNGFFSIGSDSLSGLEGNQTCYFYVFSGSELSAVVSLEL